MAMIDYGAIAFKNGKLISTDMFTPMVDMVGWEDNKNDRYYDYYTDTYKPLKLNGNYFAYIGDKDCTLAFYKCQIVLCQKYEDGSFSYHHECFDSTNYTWSDWEIYAGVDYYTIAKVTKRNGYFVCKWKYKGDKYKVYFGNGVDLRYYKKWHIVNYYRSPEYGLYRIKSWFKDKIYEWKYLR